MRVAPRVLVAALLAAAARVARCDEACPLPAADAVEAPAKRVALTSFPRTGSTWTRFLVERATGRPSGVNCPTYNGVLERGPTGVIVKTHRSGICGKACFDRRAVRPFVSCLGLLKTAEARKRTVASVGDHRFEKAWLHAPHPDGPWDGVVRVVRNPYETVRSYFHHLVRGGMQANATWSHKFVKDAVEAHATFHGTWRCCEAAVPHMILKFEDLRADTAGEIAKLTAFLEDLNPSPRHPPSAERVACAADACTLEKLRNTDPAYLRMNATTLPKPDLEEFFGGRDETMEKNGGLPYTPAMLALFDAYLHPYLKRYGYTRPAPDAAPK